MLVDSEHSDDTDEMLWYRFKTGSERDFARLFDRYSNLLFSYGLTIESDRDLVKDCIQDLFVALWQQRRQLADVKSVKIYLITALRRSLLKHKVASRRTKQQQADYAVSANVSSCPADGALLSLENVALQDQLLMKAVNQLPNRQREAVFLRFYEALSYEEISAVMSLGYQVVRNLVHRAMKTLRSELARFRAVFLDILAVVALSLILL